VNPVAFRFGVQRFIIGNQHPAVTVASQGFDREKRKDLKVADST
jgi:hypothetical protein